jgi:hypothetical protein
MGRVAGTVKSDLRLQFRVEAPKKESSTAGNLEDKLNRPGLFTLEQDQNRLTLVHRSNEGTFVRTEIKRQGKRYYIDRPKWPRVSGRRFESLADLTTALELMGMTLVR